VIISDWAVAPGGQPGNDDVGSGALVGSALESIADPQDTAAAGRYGRQQGGARHLFHRPPPSTAALACARASQSPYGVSKLITE